MTPKLLTVWPSPGQPPIMQLRWQDGVVTILHAATDMLSTAQRWQARGLTELVGEPYDAQPRYTPPTHPELFTRLRAFIESQVDLIVTLDDATNP